MYFVICLYSRVVFDYLNLHMNDREHFYSSAILDFLNLHMDDMEYFHSYVYDVLYCDVFLLHLLGRISSSFRTNKDGSIIC